MRFLSWVTFSHSIPAYDFYFSPPSLRYTSVTNLASLVTMHGHPLRGHVCSCFPSLLFKYRSSHARTKRWFYAQESCSLKNEMRANRRTLTAGRKWYWKLYLPAWQAAGSMHYSLSFNKLFIGFEKWKCPKEEGLYNSFMCIYSELLPSVRVAWTPSVIGFSTISGFYFSGSFLHIAQGCGACIIQRVHQTRLSIGQT